MSSQPDVHDWYSALESPRRDARDHTDRMTLELRRELQLLRQEARQDRQADRQEVLAAITASESRLRAEIDQLAYRSRPTPTTSSGW